MVHLSSFSIYIGEKREKINDASSTKKNRLLYS